MKYFLDTEFIEGFHRPLFGKRRHFIDLISIGVVREDGQSYYAISTEFRRKDADDWVFENVIAELPRRNVNHNPHGGDSPRVIAESKYWKDNERIKYDLLEFFGCWNEGLYFRAPEDIEVYGYYADYDWVLFCSLFGRMIDLPKGFPMYLRDLKQMMDEKVASFTNSDFFTHFLQKEPLSFEEKLKLYKDGPNYPRKDNEHNALADATWNKHLYEYITFGNQFSYQYKK